MTCPYTPMAFNIVIELDPAEEVTKGGIILAKTHVEREKLATEEGTLVAVSPFAFSYAKPEDWEGHRKPQVGDRVMIARYAGLLREKDGKAWRICEDKNLVAVVATAGDE